MFGKEHQAERSWLGDVRKRLRPKISTLLYLPLTFLFLDAEGVGSASSPIPLASVASNSTLPRPDSANVGT